MEIFTQNISCPICEQRFLSLSALREHIKQPCLPSVTAEKYVMASKSPSLDIPSGSSINQGSIMSELPSGVSNNVSTLGTLNHANIPIAVNSESTPETHVVSSHNPASISTTGNDISLLLDELSQRIPDSLISSVCNEVALRKNYPDPDPLVKARTSVAPQDSTAVKVQLVNNSVTENFTWSDIANAALDMELLQGGSTATSADVTSANAGANLSTDCSYIIVDGDNPENTIMLVSDGAAATEALKADHVKLESGLPTQDEIDAVTALLLAKSRVPHSSTTASNIIVDSQGMCLNSPSSELSLNPNNTIIQPVLTSPQIRTFPHAGVKQQHGKPCQTMTSLVPGIRQSQQFVNQYSRNIAKPLDPLTVKVKTVPRDPLGMSVKQKTIDKSPVSFQASYMDFVEEVRSRRVNTDEYTVQKRKVSDLNNRNQKTYQSEVDTAIASISGHTASGNKATRMRLSGPNLVKISNDGNIVKTTIGDCVYVPSGLCDTLTGKSVVVVYPPISKADSSHQNKMVQQTKVSSLQNTAKVSLLNKSVLNNQLQQQQMHNQLQQQLKQQMPGNYVFTNPGFKCTNVPLNSRINMTDLSSSCIPAVNMNANRADDLIVNSAAPSEIFESESTAAAAAIDQIVSQSTPTPAMPARFDQIVNQSNVNVPLNTGVVEPEMSIEEVLVEAGLATKETLPDGTVQISTTLPVEELTKILQQIPNLDVSITVSDDSVKTSKQDNDLLLPEHASKTNYFSNVSMTTESIVSTAPALKSFPVSSPTTRSVSNQVFQPTLGSASNLSSTVTHGLTKPVQPRIVPQPYTYIPDISPKPPMSRSLLSAKSQHGSLVRSSVPSYVRIPAASPRIQQQAVNKPVFSAQVPKQPIKQSKPMAPTNATTRQPVSHIRPMGISNVLPQATFPRSQYIKSAVSDRPRLTSALTQAVPMQTNKPTTETRAPVTMPTMFSRQSHNDYAAKPLPEDSSQNNSTIAESQKHVARPRVSATPKRLPVDNPILPCRPGKKVGEFCLAKPVTKIGFNVKIATVKELHSSPETIDVLEPVDKSSTAASKSPKKTSSTCSNISTRSSNRNNNNHPGSKSHTNRTGKHSLIVSGSLFSPAKKLRSGSAHSLVKVEILSEPSQKTSVTSQPLNIATQPNESSIGRNSNISTSPSKSSALNNRTVDVIPQSLSVSNIPTMDLRGRKNLERTLKLDSQQICSILSEAGLSLDSEASASVDAKDYQLVGENNGDMVYVKYTDDVEMTSDGNTATAAQFEVGNLQETSKTNDRVIVEEFNPNETCMVEQVNSARNINSKVNTNITDSNIDQTSAMSSTHSSSADASVIQTGNVVVGGNNTSTVDTPTAEGLPPDSSVQVVSLGEEDESSTDGKFILKPDGTLETLDGQPVILKDENGELISLDFLADTG